MQYFGWEADCWILLSRRRSKWEDIKDFYDERVEGMD
jgi:hypothetical protein